MGAMCESTKSKRSYSSSAASIQIAPKIENESEKINSPPTMNVVKSTNKPKFNENCYIKNKENLNIVRKIGEIKGEQVIIAYCKKSSIIILDYSAQVTIEKCSECNIFIAPCAGR